MPAVGELELPLQLILSAFADFRALVPAYPVPERAPAGAPVCRVTARAQPGALAPAGGNSRIAAPAGGSGWSHGSRRQIPCLGLATESRPGTCFRKAEHKQNNELQNGPYYQYVRWRAEPRNAGEGRKSHKDWSSNKRRRPTVRHFCGSKPGKIACALRQGGQPAFR